MKKEKGDIRVVVMNPERLPAAKEKLMKALYDEYIRETSKDDHKKVAQ